MVANVGRRPKVKCAQTQRHNSPHMRQSEQETRGRHLTGASTWPRGGDTFSTQGQHLCWKVTDVREQEE